MAFKRVNSVKNKEEPEAFLCLRINPAEAYRKQRLLIGNVCDCEIVLDFNFSKDDQEGVATDR